MSTASKRHMYHLEVCPGESLQAPSDEEISNSVRRLPGGIPSFVILTKKKNQYMQAGGSVKGGFQLEYQEFSRDGHWEHPESGNVPVDVVIQLMLWYANDDDGWRTQVHWKRLLRATREEKNREAWQDWCQSQPKEGILKGMIKGLLQIAIDEITGKRRKR